MWQLIVPGLSVVPASPIIACSLRYNTRSYHSISQVPFFQTAETHYTFFPLFNIGLDVNNAMLIPTSRSDTTASSLLQQIPGPQRILKAFTGSLGISSLSDPGSSSTPGSEVAVPNTYQECPNAELSCQSKYQGQNTCCFNYPGGQFLQTQFWDADPAVGPDDSWTIHGLW